MKRRLILPCLLLALASGCTTTTIKTANGTEFKSVRFADFTKIDGLKADLNTGTVEVQGYSGDRMTATVELAKAVAALAAQAAP